MEKARSVPQPSRPGRVRYRLVEHDVQGPFKRAGDGEGPELESVETTVSEDGSEVFLSSGYSAREIAQRRQREQGGQIYVNNISKKIKRPDLTVHVQYAVAASPVYTLVWRNDKVCRAYWPPLTS